MTEILITNAYSWNNKGDAGIILGMTKAIDEVFDDPQYTILSFTPDIDEEKYPIEAHFLNDPLNISFSSDKYNKLRIPFRALNQVSSAFLPNGIKQKTAQAYQNADLVVSCGGGFLGGHSYASLIHVFSLWLADLYNKEYYIFAQSINPTDNFIVKEATKLVLNHAQCILPREELSKQYLNELEIKPPIHMIPDAAFMLDSDDEIEMADIIDMPEEDQELIGVTTRHWPFPRYNNPDERLSNYITSVSETIDRLIEDYNTQVVFFPQVIFYPHDDDRKISHKIASRTESDDDVHVLTGDYTPRELISLAGSCDIFLGTRMHSNIFSLVAGTPTGAISYQPKTEGIMKMAGLDEFVVDIGEITTTKLYKLATKLMSNKKDISNHINNRIPELQQEILRQSKYIADDYSESSATRSLN